MAAFASALRELRHDAGEPSYAALARRAGISASTLSEAARGHKLPSWTTVEAFVRACGGDPEDWRHRWQAAAGREPPAAAFAGQPARTLDARPVVRRQVPLLRVAMIPVAGISIIAALAVFGAGWTALHRASRSPATSAGAAGRWIRVTGPGCPPGTDGAQFDVDKGWRPSGGGGWTRDGCNGGTVTTTLYDSETQWNLTVGWAFEPHLSTCRLEVYVPDSPDAEGTASYRILGKDINGPPVKDWVHIPQARHRGTWVSLGTYTFPRGVINLELYNVGKGTAYIAASAARATCD